MRKFGALLLAVVCLVSSCTGESADPVVDLRTAEAVPDEWLTHTHESEAFEISLPPNWQSFPELILRPAAGDLSSFLAGNETLDSVTVFFGGQQTDGRVEPNVAVTVGTLAAGVTAGDYADANIRAIAENLHEHEVISRTNVRVGSREGILVEESAPISEIVPGALGTRHAFSLYLVDNEIGWAAMCSRTVLAASIDTPDGTIHRHRCLSILGSLEILPLTD